MFGTKRANHPDKHSIMLIFASMLLASIGISTSSVFAMGQAPGTCDNRYDGQITSMTVTNGNQSYDPITNHDIVLQTDNDKSYSITFTIHTPSQSSQGNSLGGSTWYDTSAPGYWMGFCVNGVGPNQDVTVTQRLEHSGSIAPETTQTVSWHTFMSGDITYKVKWVNPSSKTAPDAPTSLSAKAVSSSKINLRWTAPTANGGSPITGYEIERSDDNGTTWSVISPNTGKTVTVYSDTRLSSNTTYTYRVSAINSVGASDPSNTSSATTPPGQIVAKIKMGQLGDGSSIQIKLDH
ncbi:MAG: fibronectin type III domain-containing protein [Candidatus Nitrosotenuis sp.]|nr:MAG: fibronectin type III domain-containing protein [Candidatus Nitrosotenuis sp.]